MNKPCIRVWTYEDAPSEFRILHDDVDWIAHVPAELKHRYIGWLNSTEFGCCGVFDYELEDGSILKIATHS